MYVQKEVLIHIVLLHILRCSQYIRLHNVDWIIIYELRIDTDFEVGDPRLIEELTNYFHVGTDEGCHERCPFNMTGFQLKMGTSQIQI
jgi:hypothetical protein